MRGRLINPFVAEIAQLDIAATAADPDGAGVLTSGYDKTFREPVKLVATGQRARVEKASIFVPCQVEVGVFETLQQLASGNAPDSRIVLVFHFRDLELASLVDAQGYAKLRPNDRLVSIRRKRDLTVIQAIPKERGGLYITECQPQSFGLSGGERNLLLCTFEERARGLGT